MLKKIQVLTVLCCLLSGFTVFAQTQLWGLSHRGGQYGAGTIFKTNASGNSQTVMHEFYVENEGNNPSYGTLIQATDGKLYGMTETGGMYKGGLIFRYDPTDSSYTKCYDFKYETGHTPRGSLMQASNGLFYGMTFSGGTGSNGVLFSFDPVTSVYIPLINFAGSSNGMHPYGGLIQASDGNLYGVTAEGGIYGVGVLFQFNPVTNVFIKKHDFVGSSGSQPVADLIQAVDGMLYGVTQLGGLGSVGVVYRFDLTTSVYTKVADFSTGSTGASPYGLVQATDGKMYGVTQTGGTLGFGVLYQFDPVTLLLVNKYNFGGIATGDFPMSRLIQHPNGNLYGTAGAGGVNNKGTVYEFDPVGGVFVKMVDFDGVSKGCNPWSGLLLASDGQLYGMTNSGGTFNTGALFRIHPTTFAFSKRFDFGVVEYGHEPRGSLVRASDGLLYGMTYKGGVNDAGIIFRYDPITLVYTKLFDFDPVPSGKYPTGSLVQAPDGKLYGMTNRGGTNDYGVIFQFDPVSLTYVKKLDFSTVSSGRWPIGSLMLAANGKLYGTSEIGGTNGYGVLFEFNPVNSVFTKKCDFGTPGVIGKNPQGTLMQASNGKLYGMTRYGGLSYNKGVIFEYDYVSNGYVRVHEFSGAVGGSDAADALVEAPDGNLYGMTNSGGQYGNGVLFQFNPLSNTFVKKVDFGSNYGGGNPYGSLLMASDGNLYGATYSSGINGFGVIFRYDYVSNVYTKTFDFNGPGGMNPYYMSFVEVPVVMETGAVSLSNCPGGTLTIPFWLNDSCNSGNSFVAQLSDAVGSFASPVAIGALSGRVSDSVAAQIPHNTTPGNGYRIRIVSTNPVMTATDNGSNITILPAPVAIPGTSNTAGCNTSNGSVSASFSGGTAPFFWEWMPGNIQSLIYANTPAGSYTFHVTDANGCSDSTMLAIGDSCFLVWPGDANEDGIADNLDILALGIANGTTGLTRSNATINWIGQLATDWNQSFLNGTNYKYADCDGNGNIDLADTAAVIQNFGLTHTLQQQSVVYNQTQPDLQIAIGQSVLAPASTGTISVSLGTAALPVDSLYGIAFTLHFDPQHIDAASFQMNENGSWMGVSGNNLLGILMHNGTGSGSVQIALTRLNHTDTGGFGNITNLTFMTTGILSGTGNMVNVGFTVSDVTAITADESTQTFNIINDSVLVADNIITGVSGNTSQHVIQMSPNPADETVQITWPEILSGKQQAEIELRDPVGNIIKRTDVTGTNQYLLNRAGLAAGVYFCTLVIDGCVIDVNMLLLNR